MFRTLPYTILPIHSVESRLDTMLSIYLSHPPHPHLLPRMIVFLSSPFLKMQATRRPLSSLPSALAALLVLFADVVVPPSLVLCFDHLPSPSPGTCTECRKLQLDPLLLSLLKGHLQDTGILILRPHLKRPTERKSVFELRKSIRRFPPVFLLFLPLSS